MNLLSRYKKFTVTDIENSFSYTADDSIRRKEKAIKSYREDYMRRKKEIQAAKKNKKIIKTPIIPVALKENIKRKKTITKDSTNISPLI